METNMSEANNEPTNFTEASDEVNPLFIESLDIEEDDSSWEQEEASDATTEGTEQKEEVAVADGEEESHLTAEQINTLSSMGFDENDIKTLKDNAILEKILSTNSKQPNNNNNENTTDNGDVVPGSPDENSGTDFEIKLDDTLYDADLIEQFKSMQSHYDKKISELNSVIDGLGDTAQTVQIDQMFNNSEMSKFFGKGQTNQMDPNAAETINRTKVKEEIDTLVSGYKASGKQVPEMSTLFDKAVRSALGDEMTSEARQEFIGSMESRHNNRISRPTNRATKTQGSVQTAVKNVSALMRDRGMLDPGAENFE